MLFFTCILKSVQNLGLHYLNSICLSVLLPVSGWLWNAITTCFLSKLLCHVCLLYLAANSSRKWRYVGGSALVCRQALQPRNLHKVSIVLHQAQEEYVREEPWAVGSGRTKKKKRFIMKLQHVGINMWFRREYFLFQQKFKEFPSFSGSIFSLAGKRWVFIFIST